MKSRIMYIERKGRARPCLTRGKFTNSTRTLKANYFDCEAREYYWISGCKKCGGDRLYSGTIEIDDDVRKEYWSEIRGMPERKHQKLIRCVGKHTD